MNKEIQSIINNLQRTLNGEPWYGRPVYPLLKETDPSVVFLKPNNNSHSLIEVLYHMITWAGFTLKRVEKDPTNDLAATETLDWREIDPQIHGWEEGLVQLQTIHERIIELLQTKNDAFLNEPVDFREYNFRFLLNGLVQHNIYHLGQVAYLQKLLV